MPCPDHTGLDASSGLAGCGKKARTALSGAAAAIGGDPVADQWRGEAGVAVPRFAAPAPDSLPRPAGEREEADARFYEKRLGGYPQAIA